MVCELMREIGVMEHSTAARPVTLFTALNTRNPTLTTQEGKVVLATT